MRDAAVASVIETVTPGTGLVFSVTWPMTVALPVVGTVECCCVVHAMAINKRMKVVAIRFIVSSIGRASAARALPRK